MGALAEVKGMRESLEGKNSGARDPRVRVLVHSTIQTHKIPKVMARTEMKSKGTRLLCDGQVVVMTKGGRH